LVIKHFLERTATAVCCDCDVQVIMNRRLLLLLMMMMMMSEFTWVSFTIYTYSML